MKLYFFYQVFDLQLQIFRFLKFSKIFTKVFFYKKIEINIVYLQFLFLYIYLKPDNYKSNLLLKLW